MNKSTLIQSILEANTIVDYLSSKGIDPARNNGARLKYCCPIHQEKTPSFYVFTTKEFQYFHCFGCRAHGDIINLVSKLEGMSIKAAIGKLAWGLNIPESEVVERLALDIENARTKDEMTLEDIAIRLSKAFHVYLQWTKFDPAEVAFMEEVFKKIDKMIVAMDLEALRTVYDKVVDEGIPARRAAYLARKEREEESQYKATTHARRPRLQ